MITDRITAEKQTDILVVEDSLTQAQFLARLLLGRGYTVRVASNGLEGLRAARESLPTLIIADINMPEMDGFAMCKEIKNDPALRDIPVILLTALTGVHDVIKGLDCGASNFIRKPFDSANLLRRVKLILANLALRTTEHVEPGMLVKLGGQTHTITAERQQIFDLLMSTFEEAVQLTEELKAQRAQIEHSYQSLEGLYRIAEALNPAVTELAVIELALDAVLAFPGVLGACIKLFDGGVDGATRMIAARNYTIDEQEIMACECQRGLQSARLRAPQLVSSCEGLGKPHACVSMMTGATRGILILLTSPGMLTAHGPHLMATVGNQIAVAIERARLYGQMELQVRERTDAWQAERTLLTAVVNTSGALVCLADAAGTIRLFNPACERAIGRHAPDAIGKPCWEVFDSPNGNQELRRFFASPGEHRRPSQLRSELRNKEGGIRSIIWSTTWLKNTDGSVAYFLATGIDVTELREAEQQVRYLSNFDALTGLPKTTLLRDRVQQMIEEVAPQQQVLGFLLLLPGRLNLVRENLGVEAEYAMLIQIAERLGQWNHDKVNVARVSEHTFAIVAVRNSVAELSALARKVLTVMSAPFTYGQQELHIDPCIGIALFPNDGDDYDRISQGAEAAMRRATNNGAERYEFYRPELNEGAHERFQFETALRHALARGEFLLHYQPQVNLSSGKIIGVEALVRWQHPELGMVPPGRFIGLAEETGLILSIGEWVLRRACEQSCAWQREGLPPVPVSVNLSACQFSDNIAATVGRILRETGLEPCMLELELTESASMDDPGKTFEILRQLKDMGVQLAIDDFGTGYSNLNYLKRFPVDKLKLDQSFVKDLISDPNDLSIARAVIAMGHGLGLIVIAEGVETAGQLALLAENGCDEMQGYFFSRPVDAETCGNMLRQRTSLRCKVS